MLAIAPELTPIRLNIWLTNPHLTMPNLVLYPQEAADVIAYIFSLREQHSGFGRSQTDGRNKVVL